MSLKRLFRDWIEISGIEVAVIGGILFLFIAIALPQLLAYRTRGFNHLVESDARNAATAQESYFTWSGLYYTGDCRALPGFTASLGVQCDTQGNAEDFVVWTWHPRATVNCRWYSGESADNRHLVCVSSHGSTKGGAEWH